MVVVQYSLVTNPRWQKQETEMIQKQQLDEKYPIVIPSGHSKLFLAIQTMDQLHNRRPTVWVFPVNRGIARVFPTTVLVASDWLRDSRF